MNLKLDSQVVRMERFVGEGHLQTTAEGTVSLAAGLPDIGRIIRVSARPRVTEYDVLENQVAVEGAVDITLIYAAPEEGSPYPAARGDVGDDDIGVAQSVEGEEEAEGAFADDEEALREGLYRAEWRRSLTFYAELDVAGATHDDSAYPEVSTEHVEVDVRDDGRTVDVDAVLDAVVRVVRYEEATIPVKGPQFGGKDIVLAEEVVRVEDVAGTAETHLSVQGTLRLAEGDPPMERVVQATATPATPLEVQVHDNKVTVAGTLNYAVAYSSAAAPGPVETADWDQQTPFSFTFDVPGVRAGGEAGAVAEVTGLDVNLGAVGRDVEVYADVSLSLRVAQVRTLGLITGLTSEGDDQVEVRTVPVDIEEWIGDSSRTVTVDGVLEATGDHPAIERLIDHDARVHITEVLVLGDKVAVEGHADVGLFYVARTGDGEHPLYYGLWHQVLALEFEIPVQGAQPQMQAEVKADVSDVQLDLINRETVEVRATVEGTARVHRAAEKDVVAEAVAVPAPDPHPPTLTFVVAEEEESLWRLSRRYHTTEEAIRQANPWLEAETDYLPVGRKVCVPRKAPAAPVAQV